MPKVRLENYSTYFEIKTRTQFSPVLDRRSGLFVGVATVSPKVANTLAENPAFEILSDDEFAAMTTLPEPEDEEDAPSETGDPLAAAAKRRTPARPKSPKPSEPSEPETPELS